MAPPWILASEVFLFKIYGRTKKYGHFVFMYSRRRWKKYCFGTSVGGRRVKEEEIRNAGRKNQRIMWLVLFSIQRSKEFRKGSAG